MKKKLFGFIFVSFMLGIVLLIIYYPPDFFKKPIVYHTSGEASLNRFAMAIEDIISTESNWWVSAKIKILDTNYPKTEMTIIAGEPIFLVDKLYRYGAQEEKHGRNYKNILIPSVMWEPIPYRAQENGHIIQYISNGDWYILASCGPDLVYEKTTYLKILQEKEILTKEQILEALQPIAYDATNGTMSSGDIFRTSFDALEQ